MLYSVNCRPAESGIQNIKAPNWVFLCFSLGIAYNYKNMNNAELFNHPYLICDEKDQGLKTKGICIFNGVQVDTAFTVGPITLRPFNKDTDQFPDDIRRDLQYSVLELNYVDRASAMSMYVEPMWVQETAFKAIQLMVNSWAGISFIYHFRETGEQVGGASGSTRFETADTESVHAGAILAVTEENKEIFKAAFWACFGDMKHAINRYSRACSEIKDESILDFVIALEATLGYKLNSEIAHRLASRGAFLLGADPTVREKYYCIFKAIYNIRSRIAHGDVATAKVPEAFVDAITTLGYWSGDWSKEIDLFRIRYIADVARQITRQVLLKFIEKPQFLNEETLLKLELGL